MIDSQCFTAEWIATKSKEYQYSDRNIIEKVIRAFSLLDMLAASGCPFPDFVIASPLPELTTKIWPENPIFSSYLVGTHMFVEYAKFGCVTQNAFLQIVTN
jgi:hypothetical protein